MANQKPHKMTDPEESDATRDFTEMQAAMEIDRMVHEPARLMILAVLSKVEWTDFHFLLRATGLSKGNLSRHASKLEEAGYIEIEKYFAGKIPATRYRMTPAGHDALATYWRQMTSLQAQVVGDRMTG
jgi:DNA-binding transcriptional ArsR family regulator